MLEKIRFVAKEGSPRFAASHSCQARQYLSVRPAGTSPAKRLLTRFHSISLKISPCFANALKVLGVGRRDEIFQKTLA